MTMQPAHVHRAVVWASVALSGAFAPPTARPQSPLVSGVVLARDAKPVDRALVTLVGGSPAEERSVLTSADGAFAFRDVVPGSYQLAAMKAGYLRAAFGATFSGAAGTPVVVAASTVSGLEMRLTRSAAIAGTIRDQYGNPVAGLRVNALRWGYGTTPFDRGVRGLRPLARSAAETDSKGAYRIFDLPPGDYIVAIPSRAAASEPLTIATADDVRRAEAIRGGRPDPGEGSRASRFASHPQTFHPGTTAVSAAVTVRVAPGDERSAVDIVAKPEPMMALTGAIASAAGDAPTRPPRVWVNTKEKFPEGDSSFGSAGLDGSFSGFRVFAGTYILNGLGNFLAGAASGYTHWARAEVQVGDREPAPLTLIWRPLVGVTGRIQFEGEPDAATSASAVSITLFELGETRFADVPSARTRADGGFLIPGITPSRYRITVGNPAGWRLKSIKGENDLDLADAAFNVREDGAPALTATFTKTTTTLTGSLQEAGGRPATAYTVVAFGRDRNYWTPHTRRVAAARPGTDGSFQFSGLPAGDYLLAAVTDLEEGQAFNPDYLASLVPSAVPVTLIEGAKIIQNIRIAR